ncbi:MAG: hypothetical protein J0L88_07860 [Xanthomonadales bacterium]|nr:hypothetical protein [Xanthomonadales bacterium]
MLTDRSRRTARPFLRGATAGLALAATLASAQPTVDGFDPNPNGTVTRMTVQPDGKVLVAGFFTQIAAQFRSRFVRLAADGTFDGGFASTGPDNTIIDASLQPDGKIVIGGAFTFLGATARNRVARLNTNGTLDSAFNPNADGDVSAVIVLPNGKIIIGGAFSTVGGLPRSSVARLNADGSVDPGFDAQGNSFTVIRALALQADGRILVAGSLSGFGAGQFYGGLTRVHADGALDGSFTANVASTVWDVVIEGNGDILIGGDFGTVNSQQRRAIARLDASGTLYTDFTPSIPSDRVNSVVVQADGRILLGGSFTQVNGTARAGIARLTHNGSLDTTLDIGANGGIVNDLVEQAGGRVLVGGTFTQLGTQPRSRIGRIQLQEVFANGFD